MPKYTYTTDFTLEHLDTETNTLFQFASFFNLTLETFGLPPTIITSVTGTCIYAQLLPASPIYNIISPATITILPIGTILDGSTADNILQSLTLPFFTTTGGLGIHDTSNNIQYLLKGLVLIDAETSNYLGEINASNLVNESLQEQLQLCLLETTKILTPIGYKLITEIKKDDYILSENNREIKVTDVVMFEIDFSNSSIPYIVPKGKFGAIEDLYISGNHAIKINDNFKHAKRLKLCKISKETLKEMNKPKYYHLSLECSSPNENHRTNTLIANGVVVESFDGTRFGNNQKIRISYDCVLL